MEENNNCVENNDLSEQSMVYTLPLTIWFLEISQYLAFIDLKNLRLVSKYFYKYVNYNMMCVVPYEEYKNYKNFSTIKVCINIKDMKAIDEKNAMFDQVKYLLFEDKNWLESEKIVTRLLEDRKFENIWDQKWNTKIGILSSIIRLLNTKIFNLVFEQEKKHINTGIFSYSFGFLIEYYVDTLYKRGPGIGPASNDELDMLDKILKYSILKFDNVLDLKYESKFITQIISKGMTDVLEVFLKNGLDPNQYIDIYNGGLINATIFINAKRPNYKNFLVAAIEYKFIHEGKWNLIKTHEDFKLAVENYCLLLIVWCNKGDQYKNIEQTQYNTAVINMGKTIKILRLLLEYGAKFMF